MTSAELQCFSSEMRQRFEKTRESEKARESEKIEENRENRGEILTGKSRGKTDVDNENGTRRRNSNGRWLPLQEKWLKVLDC